MTLAVLAMGFGTLLITANVVAVKPVALGDWVVPAGTIAYPFTFLITDSISELYGRKVATRIVWCGFGLSAAMVALIYVAQVLPAADFWEGQSAFETTLGSVPRIVLGSMIAYLISQHSDVHLFHRLRRATHGRHLWLRNNGSTMMSQAIDTTLFISIAFAGTVPASVLWNMMATQYVIKLAIAFVDTALVYMLVGWIRSRKEYSLEARTSGLER